MFSNILVFINLKMNNVGITKILKSDKIVYRLLRFLPNNEIVNFMLTCKKVYKKVVVNKAIYKNLLKEPNKE